MCREGREFFVSEYRARLPQLDGGLFLTDGGIETDLIFNDGMELPHFAAFDLLRTEKGTVALRAYYARYATIAKANAVGFILESPTWRASADWGRKLGYSQAALARTNAQAIELMAQLRGEYRSNTTPMVISGCVGPRGDGYDAGTVMSADEAQAYHAEQIGVFAETDADMVTAITMTNANEAIGLTRAAQAAGMPVAIAFTLETDGRLPTGQGLRQAVEEVDAATGNGPALYGTFVVKGGHIIVFTFILLFDPRREHSSVPTAVPLAVARGGGQGWRDSATRRACP